MASRTSHFPILTSQAIKPVIPTTIRSANLFWTFRLNHGHPTTSSCFQKAMLKGIVSFHPPDSEAMIAIPASRLATALASSY